MQQIRKGKKTERVNLAFKSLFVCVCVCVQAMGCYSSLYGFAVRWKTESSFTRQKLEKAIYIYI